MERKSQSWFDKECYRKRQQILELLQKAKYSTSVANLRQYNDKRRKYKRLLRAKQMDYIEMKAKQLIDSAIVDPFIEEHFQRILNVNDGTAAFLTQHKNCSNFPRITEEEEEEEEAIVETHNRKALGPDSIFNKHL
ncbi:hypothetical protein ANN_19213 [Periplaneta americana]|uniref:Uncharacterized protein n=1 Tax=Periplaneta americana TaxID=6978 RepID=A0ABQ8S9U0_PERAM|nr:hypothetical protein ANN_19213 [Periplaneta americana]